MYVDGTVHRPIFPSGFIEAGGGTQFLHSGGGCARSLSRRWSSWQSRIYRWGKGGLVAGAVEAAAEGVMAEGYVGGFVCEEVVLNKVEGMRGWLDIVLT